MAVKVMDGTGGDAGGLRSYIGSNYNAAVKIATQVSGHAFGYGKGGYRGQSWSGGGGGYYGGDTSDYDPMTTAGGSSFISGHLGCIAIKSETNREPKVTDNPVIEDSYHYSGKIFNNTIMIDGSGYNWTFVKENYIGMPPANGTDAIIGNLGDGYARITYLQWTTY